MGATIVVDSTFTTLILQRPMQLGADIVMHSATKYIGGHSDLLMGALVAADDALAEVRVQQLSCVRPVYLVVRLLPSAYQWQGGSVVNNSVFHMHGLVI